jgi:hypothetical protein
MLSVLEVAKRTGGLVIVRRHEKFIWERIVTIFQCHGTTSEQIKKDLQGEDPAAKLRAMNLIRVVLLLALANDYYYPIGFVHAHNVWLVPNTENMTISGW